MRALLTGTALATALLGQANAAAQTRMPDRYEEVDQAADRDAEWRENEMLRERYDERFGRDRGGWADGPDYDDRAVADMDAAQRRFDEAQARYDRERAAYEQERTAYEVARGRMDRRRDILASRAPDPVWRGPPGRVVGCRRTDPTASAVVGGVVGGLLGRAIDGGRRRGVGTILGAGVGGLFGAGVANSQYGGCR